MDNFIKNRCNSGHPANVVSTQEIPVSRKNAQQQHPPMRRMQMMITNILNTIHFDEYIIFLYG
jgi:hypothetical protein